MSGVRLKKGCVDCSGAFVYAFRQYGERIAHGSNTIARQYIKGELLPLYCAKPGMVAFKCREWTADESGNRWYNKPPGDIHHVGLVDEDTAYVLNAKGEKSGFCRDKLTAKNGWDYVAYLKGVEYEGREKSMMATIVLPTGASGNTVNMRSGASKSKEIISRIPVGATVEVLNDQGQWCEVGYAGQVGWVMSNYIEYAGQGGESGGDAITEEERLAIDTALHEIEEQIEVIRSALGRG